MRVWQAMQPAAAALQRCRLEQRQSHEALQLLSSQPTPTCASLMLLRVQAQPPSAQAEAFPTQTCPSPARKPGPAPARFAGASRVACGQCQWQHAAHHLLGRQAGAALTPTALMSSLDAWLQERAVLAVAVAPRVSLLLQSICSDLGAGL